MLKRQEEFYERIKAGERQNLDKNSVWYGDYYDNVNIVEQVLPLYIHPQSRYYKSAELLERMNINVDFFLRMQFPNGLLSLWNCNIISPPDTAFNVYPLCLCVDLIDRVQMPELQPLREKILLFLERTIPGLVTGGFHTPNHRWIISCALSLLYKRFPRPEIKDRVCQFIAEGIDNNADGEWTERSNGCYSPVLDMWCFHIAEVFGEEAFLDAARRNLNMMKYLLHPGDEIATEYSSRQDRGTRVKMAGYAIPYLLMAAKDNNAEFAYMAELCIRNGDSFGRLLIYRELYKELLCRVPAPKEISTHYIKYFNEGTVSALRQRASICGDSLIRCRNGKLSLTVMAGQPDFMFIQYGKARAASIKSVIGWFGMGGIAYTRIERIGERKFVLSTPIYGDYMQVLPKETAEAYHGQYLKMPNAERERINRVETYAEMTVTLLEDGVDLSVTVDQQPYIFTQLVFGFDAEGTLSGEGLKELPNGAFNPSSKPVRYENDGDWIEVCGDSEGHPYDFIRGDTYNASLKNAVFNALSPKDWHIQIRCGEKE